MQQLYLSDHSLCLQLDRLPSPFDDDFSPFLFIPVLSPSTPSIATRAAAATSTHPSGTSVLSRHRSSSATNPSGVTSPLSPSNINSNHLDHSGQSMSPPSISSSQSMPNTATRTSNPPTATKIASESNLDSSISVRRNDRRQRSLSSSGF